MPLWLQALLVPALLIIFLVYYAKKFEPMRTKLPGKYYQFMGCWALLTVLILVPRIAPGRMAPEYLAGAMLLCVILTLLAFGPLTRGLQQERNKK